jgi:hypothetical protein
MTACWYLLYYKPLDHLGNEDYAKPQCIVNIRVSMRMTNDLVGHNKSFHPLLDGNLQGNLSQQTIVCHVWKCEPGCPLLSAMIHDLVCTLITDRCLSNYLLNCKSSEFSDSHLPPLCPLCPHYALPLLYGAFYGMNGVINLWDWCWSDPLELYIAGESGYNLGKVKNGLGWTCAPTFLYGQCVAILPCAVFRRVSMWRTTGQN